MSSAVSGIVWAADLGQAARARFGFVLVNLEKGKTAPGLCRFWFHRPLMLETLAGVAAVPFGGAHASPRSGTFLVMSRLPFPEPSPESSIVDRDRGALIFGSVRRRRRTRYARSALPRCLRDARRMWQTRTLS